jgi:hypothetical protein
MRPAWIRREPDTRERVLTGAAALVAGAAAAAAVWYLGRLLVARDALELEAPQRSALPRGTGPVGGRGSAPSTELRERP